MSGSDGAGWGLIFLFLILLYEGDPDLVDLLGKWIEVQMNLLSQQTYQ